MADATVERHPFAVRLQSAWARGYAAGLAHRACNAEQETDADLVLARATGFRDAQIRLIREDHAA
jgi:hypothetical protein